VIDMKPRISRSILLLCLAAPAASVAQIPKVDHAKLETASAAAGLENAVRQAVRNGQPVWAAWTVPMIAGERYNCCWSHRGDFKDVKSTACHLEGRNQSWGSTDDVKVPANQDLMVLARLEEGKIGRVLAFSSTCEIDADGRRFVWLGAAKPEESVALLAKTADADSRKISEEALAALSYHRNARADDVLEAMASAPKPTKVRENALFWIGQNRGERGARFLTRVVTSDPETEIRKKAIFSLSQSKAPGVADPLIRVSREDRNGDVRGEALFWLAQMNDPKSADAIFQAIDKDPDMGVRKKGIFALSQLKGGGVPLLIQLGRQTRDREVRKEALFWLTQSKDPEALKYIDRVLNE
jgi:HEAT repeats